MKARLTGELVDTETVMSGSEGGGWKSAGASAMVTRWLPTLREIEVLRPPSLGLAKAVRPQSIWFFLAAGYAGVSVHRHIIAQFIMLPKSGILFRWKTERLPFA